MKQPHIDVSFSFSFPSPLYKNKYINKIFIKKERKKVKGLAKEHTDIESSVVMARGNGWGLGGAGKGGKGNIRNSVNNKNKGKYTTMFFLFF